MIGVEEIVRGHLGPDRLQGVRVQRSLNSDGEPILRVFIIYEGGKPAPTVDEMLTITDELWDRVLQDGTSDLVVPSFISSDDDAIRRSA